jgi:chemotaxis signal transduction protein
MNPINSELVKDSIFEFVEFQIGKSHYGIGIQYVREIIEPLPVTVLPHAHPYIEGIIQLRGEVLPVIDLGKVTNDVNEEAEESKFIVSELSDTTVVFRVTTVVQIQRMNRTEIEVSSELYKGETVPVTGVIKRENEMILLVDFEKVIEEQFK